MKKLILTGAVLMSTVLIANAQITVNNNITLDEAITLLLGPDVNYSNVTFSGDANQKGSFDITGFDIGFNNGLILASGDCAMAPGPNTSTSQSLGGANFGASDPDLDDLDGLTHNDAAILEFDFVATGSSVSFRYVWASEEYPEYSGADGDGDGFSDCGDVSDVFGFFLSGPGIAGPFTNNAVNIALIPNSTDFVSINNLNGGCAGTAVEGDNDCNYCQYYVMNEGGNAPFNTFLQYDGLTITLTAFYEGLECGQTYHIKLAMADVSDTAFDSAVFLEAGSFSVAGSLIDAIVVNPDPNLGNNATLEGCIDGAFIIHPPACQTEDIVIELQTGGTATSGVDYEAIPNSITISGEDVEIPIVSIADNLPEGTETITVFFYYEDVEGNIDTASATINLVDYTAPVVIVEDIAICGSNEMTDVTVTNGFGQFTYLYSSGQTTQTAVYGPGDAGEYTLTVTDFCGVIGSDDFVVTEPSPLIVVPLVELCLGNYSEEIVEGGAEPYTYIFEEDSLNYNQGLGFSAQFPSTYTVFVTDACGASGSTTIIAENCDTRIPNIFTPNGDNVNDFFFIEGIQGFPDSKITIRNRWGNVVYESSNYNNKWTATDCPDGVYYYVFERADGENFEGYVHVVREK